MHVALSRKSTLLAAALLLAPAVRAQAPEDADKFTRDWIKTRLEAAKLKSDWSYGQAIMTSTLHGLKEHADELEKQLADRKARHADALAELTALRTRKNEALASEARINSAVGGVAAQVLALRPTLPSRLSDALEVAYSSLARSDLGAADQMQLAMTILNRCIQFDHTITCGEEVIALPGEPRRKMLEVIYWGLSQGYAVDRPAKRAWHGSVQDGHWTWRPLESGAMEVAQLVDIYNDKAEPAFVSLRAQIKSGSTDTAAHAP